MTEIYAYLILVVVGAGISVGEATFFNIQTTSIQKNEGREESVEPMIGKTENTKEMKVDGFMIDNKNHIKSKSEVASRILEKKLHCNTGYIIRFQQKNYEAF